MDTPQDPNLPTQLVPTVAPQVPQEIIEVQEGVPIPYKVPDYEDSIPVGKSLAIVGSIIIVIVSIFFLAKSSNTVDLQGASKDSVDFSKMNGQQQRQPQGQVAGAQSYGPPGPSSKPAPTEKTTKTPTPTTDAATPTPTNSPTPTPTKKPDEPTNTPTQTPTNTPPPTETPTTTPTGTITPTP